MNASPAPDGSPHAHERAARRTQVSQGQEAESVPRQKGGSGKSEALFGATTDLLEHPDPHTAAQAAAVENLLRCWVREHDLAAPADGALRIPLPASGTALVVPVQYWSPTGWHRLGPPHLSGAPDQAPPTDAVTLAALLGRETPMQGPPTAPAGSAPAHVSTEATTSVAPGAAVGPQAPIDGGDLVGRVADSLRRTVVFITDRRENPADGPDLFLSAEQSLLLGHPLHPTPKSREGLTGVETRLYSPESRGSFVLYWMAVAPSVLATDSAWTERGRPYPRNS